MLYTISQTWRVLFRMSGVHALRQNLSVYVCSRTRAILSTLSLLFGAHSHTHFFPVPSHKENCQLALFRRVCACRARFSGVLIIHY